MIHTMVDIETLSTRPNALVLSIGAVKFDADTIYEKFTIGIDPVDAQRRHGRHIDAGTILYWFEPKMAEARQALLDLPKIDLFSALDGYAMWMAQTPLDQRGSLWGKGSTFDNVILRDAAENAGIEWPVTYRQDECYRTIANRFPDVKFEAIGTAHVAVQDAESQAVHLQRIAKAHGIVL